ncbi:vWA domain-containing protein [Paenibacillus cymbidii]|uniref:hypothetical protein n=1 Tax=Paenibacillus cymbidii TaxID=1639034 RepID=UPI00108135FC|nr:hypothetical protein [Paenibacillus cymbidii]
METKDLIRECIMLPGAIDIVNQGFEQLREGSNFLKTLYGHAAKVLHTQMMHDYRELSRELRSRGYTIVAGDKGPTGQTYIVRIRGSSDRTMTVPADVAKRETDAILERYVKQLEHDLENRRYAQ